MRRRVGEGDLLDAVPAADLDVPELEAHLVGAAVEAVRCERVGQQPRRHPAEAGGDQQLEDDEERGGHGTRGDDGRDHQAERECAADAAEHQQEAGVVRRPMHDGLADRGRRERAAATQLEARLLGRPLRPYQERRRHSQRSSARLAGRRDAGLRAVRGSRSVFEAAGGEIAATWRAPRRCGILAVMAATPIDNDARAQQLARAIASDIQLYNKQKIEEALINDNFFDALGEEIMEGRDLFRGRVTPELFRKNYYDRAIVDRVIKPMASLKTHIW